MTDQEINHAVARKLKGEDTRLIKDYCHSIEAAWEIVGYMAKQHFGVSVSHDNLRDLWQCGIESIKEPGQYETADTAPMAICLAFLKLP